MTHLILLLLILMLFAHDEVLGVADSTSLPSSPWIWLVFCVLARAVVALAYRWVVQRTVGRLGTRQGSDAMKQLDRATLAYQIHLPIFFFFDLALGGLLTVRMVMGDDILVDEVLILMPTIAMMLWQWWAYYPIDRRMREAQMLDRMEQGLSLSRLWTRREYVVNQVRYQLLLILLPLLAMYAWAEWVMSFGPDGSAQLSEWATLPLTIAGAVVIFMFVPLVIRFLWDTQPMPEGEMRDRLLAMCARYRVRVRELLLWQTYGGLVNAAVIGLASRLRYILLSDGLLEQMTPKHVEAVMAHEICHVHRRHMIWMVVAAVSLAGLLQLATVPLTQAMWLGSTNAADPEHLVLADGMQLLVEDYGGDGIAVTLAMALAIAVWVMLFGFISRRYERQADTFAVQHMVAISETPQTNEDGKVIVDVHSARTMIDALQKVAELNQMSTSAHNWRHGSIEWRQTYLRQLVGKPVDELPIDEGICWINRLALAGFILLLILQTTLLVAPHHLAPFGF